MHIITGILVIYNNIYYKDCLSSEAYGNFKHKFYL